MNKLTLYLGKTVLTTIFLALLLLVGLEIIFSLVNEVRHIGTNDYTLTSAFSFLLFSIPTHIVQLFPMAALLGTLMGLGLLAGKSELIVMRAAGLSVIDIILILFKSTLWLIALVFLFQEVIAPVSDKIAHEHKSLALSSGQALKTVHGTWIRDGDNFVHIQNSDLKGNLEGVMRYEFDDRLELKKSSFAKTAHYDQNGWILHDVKETNFSDNGIKQQKVSQQKWETRIDPQVLNIVGIKDLDNLTLVGLWQTIQFKKANHLDPKPYELALWQKLIRPFASLVMIFLAIPFIFGPLRNATLGLKIVLGIGVGFCFYTINQLFGPLTLVYQIPPFWGAILPTLIFLGVGLGFIKNIR